MSKLSDEWQTPQWLFDELNSEFHFDIDLCATRENSKCMLYTNNYLNFNQWMNYKTAWMNPPYSNPRPFIEKAWDDSRFCKIVCLVKTDHSTRWWATFWDYGSPYPNCRVCYNDNVSKIMCKRCRGTGRWRTDLYNGPKPGCDVKLLPKRIKFNPPQQFIDSGEVWKVGTKWRQICREGDFHKNSTHFKYIGDNVVICDRCKGKGFTVLSGPTFPSSLIIMNRGNI